MQLFKPCICAGSIAYVHQPCLEATIAEKRIDKCPVCHYKYQFKPLYAKHTPEHLTKTEVISGLIIRAANKWIPFTLRVFIVLIVWIVLLPLFTSYIYIAWGQGPSVITSRLGLRLQQMPEELLSSISTFNSSISNNTITLNVTSSTADNIDIPTTATISILKLLFMDVVSGLEITATIIISALSMLSLVEHFRFHWQPQRLVQPNNNNNNNQNVQQGPRQRHQQQQQPNDLNNNDDNNEQVIDHEIIDQELKRMLKNIGFESNDDKAEHGADGMTSGEEDDNNQPIRSTMGTSKDNIHEHDDYHSNNYDIMATKQDDVMNDMLISKRKSIGVMDQGQMIFSDDMNDISNSAATSASATTNALHPLHPDYRNFEENDNQANHHHSSMASRTSSFYSATESITSQLINNDDDDDDSYLHDRDLLQSCGTPIKRHRKRESLQQQLFEKGVIENLIDLNNNDRNEEYDKHYQHGNNDNDSHDDDENDIDTQMQQYRQYRQQHLDNERNNNLNPQQETNEKKGDDMLDDVDATHAQFERMMRLQEEAEQQQDDDEDDDLFRFNRQNIQGNLNAVNNNGDDNPDLREPLVEPAAIGNQDMVSGVGHFLFY